MKNPLMVLHCFQTQKKLPAPSVLPPARLWAESRLAEPLARASQANIAAHGSGNYGSNG